MNSASRSHPCRPVPVGVVPDGLGRGWRPCQRNRRGSDSPQEVTLAVVRMLLRAEFRHRCRSWVYLALLVALVSGLVSAGIAAGRRTTSAFPGTLRPTAPMSRLSALGRFRRSRPFPRSRSRRRRSSRQTVLPPAAGAGSWPTRTSGSRDSRRRTSPVRSSCYRAACPISRTPRRFWPRTQCSATWASTSAHTSASDSPRSSSGTRS